MFVGVARFVFQIPAARSLKDRRRAVRSFKDRLRAKLAVSVAEVGNAEAWQVATIGVAVVAGDSGRCAELLGAVTNMARGVPEAILADVRTEIVSFGHGGSGVQGGLEKFLEGEEP